MTEDYPGQADEIRRERLIKMAVEAGDKIIMEGANGSVEELEFLTGKVAEQWVGKTVGGLQAKLLKHDLAERHKKS